MSLGRAWLHQLPQKLAMAAKYGLQGIEVFFEDLELLAKERAGKDPTEGDLLSAASEIRGLCDKNGLKVIALQPFLHYEGLTNQIEHQAMIEKMKLWFELANILGTDIIQIPTQFRPQTEGVSGDMDLIVKDMTEVADLGLQETPVIKIAYENLCWGTFTDTWERVWDVVKRVDRPNFGICLDTFHIAGGVWADPASENGRIPDADAKLNASLERMKKMINASKIWYVQIVGAERLEHPLVKGHEYYAEGQPSRMSWSRNFRLFYGEEDLGQYLPINRIAKVILQDLKFDGWVSMELFSRTLADPRPEVPEEHAKRAGIAWKKLVQGFDL
jgi:4-hydroxyphenylpyruvate dioxygenase